MNVYYVINRKAYFKIMAFLFLFFLILFWCINSFISYGFGWNKLIVSLILIILLHKQVQNLIGKRRKLQLKIDNGILFIVDLAHNNKKHGLYFEPQQYKLNYIENIWINSFKVNFGNVTKTLKIRYKGKNKTLLDLMDEISAISENEVRNIASFIKIHAQHVQFNYPGK